MSAFFSSKDEARKYFRELRNSLSASERRAMDEAIAQRVLQLDEFLEAKVVFTYLSSEYEVDTRMLIQAAWGSGKTVAIPRCSAEAGHMDWFVISDFENLEVSSFGIEEPRFDAASLIMPPPSDSGLKAVALVPGYSFDKAGYRLGYGGGYYDRFLSLFGGVSIGLCRSCQLSQQLLIRDEYDIAVNLVVTDLETFEVCTSL